MQNSNGENILQKHKYSFFLLQKRLLALGCGVIFLFFVVIIKLFSIQIVGGKTLQTRAISQWTRDLSMSGLRGDIVDRNGEILATSYTTYNVYVRASNIKDADAVAKTLTEVLDVDFDWCLKKAQNKKVSESLIKQQVPFEKAKELIERDVDGIYLSETSSRYYPNEKLLSSVLGYCNIDGKGQFGLELFYDKLLKGLNGTTYTESDITGLELSNATTSYVQGMKGSTIQLTIDLSLTQALQMVVDLAQKEQQAKEVQAILMNPQNGEILAVATSNSFDLNNPPRDDLQTLLNFSKNTMITDVYEPGSTFKIFTTAAALEEKLTSLDERFYDPGFRIVDGQKIKCWKTTGHGSETLVEGFANSCNSVFMDLGLRLGTERFYNYLKKFGIGSKTGIDFVGESGGIMMTQGVVKNVDLARISFGQAVAVTPLQMLTSVCGVLSGTLFEPCFLKSVTNPNGIKKEYSCFAKTKTVSHETSQNILNMMEQVVSKSDGLYSFVPGYRIAGKTGTAQKYENGKIANGKYISSFVGAYPVENPQFALLLCVNEPGAGQYYANF